MKEARYVITRYKNRIMYYTLNNATNKFDSLGFSNEDAELNCIGNIYVAKVINVNKNLSAAFIEYLPNGIKGFLPFNPHNNVVLLNREYDGRLIAGDELLVQLEKEAVRTKEPVFTTNLSLAGKYCVVTSGNKIKSVSKKCSKEQREVLRCAIPKDSDYGIIIRTNAVEQINNIEIIKEECSNLVAEINKIIQYGKHRTCFSCIWQAPPAYFTFLRDSSDFCFTKIITDDSDIYSKLKNYLQMYHSDLVNILELYNDPSYTLDKLHSIQTKIDELMGERVWLKSGAYLIIEKTEALYVIDVNSGKNIQKNIKGDYIYSINLESAHEIMRQIRLRNMSGIILIDFINMPDSESEEKLLYELKTLAKKDKIATTVVDITPLGLVEITRKKVQKSLQEQLS
ncbi:MAG: ribonuclease E/G [Lachnospiraceae bacterium]|nr:ribonuclease E/G [Lachnospiraceae bacterium]